MADQTGPLTREDLQRLGPGYWRDEVSGDLAAAVHAYLDGRALDGEQLALLRAYFIQWIGAPIWDRNPFEDGAGLARLRAAALTLKDRAGIGRWLRQACAIGLDPL